MRTLLVRFALSVGALAAALASVDCHPAGEVAPAPDAAPSAVAVASVSATTSAPPSSTAPAFPVPRASVEAVLNPLGLPAYDGPTGSVEGTITVKGPSSPDVSVPISKCAAALDTYGKLFREGHPTTPGGPRPLADAVVVVTGYEGFALTDKSDVVKVTIGTNCAYPSRTIAVTFGQRLEISNKTRLLFAPVIADDEATAVMVAPPQENGDPVKLYPTRAGYFALTDRMEPFVRENLYVFRHPLHAVSDLDGHYRIDGLPVGKLKVGVHHPTVDADAEAPVDVVAGVVQKVDLTLTYKPKQKPKVPDAGVPMSTRCLRWLDPDTKLKCAEYDRPND